MYVIRLSNINLICSLFLSVSITSLTIHGSDLMAAKLPNASRVFQNPGNLDGTLLVKKTPRLKILAGVSEFGIVQTKDLQNNVRNKFVPKKKIFRTLKARLNDTSTFHIKNYKFEIQATSFNKKNRVLKLNIAVSKTFGTYQQIEEKLGAMNVTGLIHSFDGENVFIANQEMVFKDKVGTPKLALQIMDAGQTLKNTVLSKKTSTNKKVTR